MLKQVYIPDIGTASGVNVIEILVKMGDIISKEASLITLETDKATMEIPSPYAGKIESINIKVNDKVSEGDLILTMEVAEEIAQKEVEKTTEEKPAEKKGAKETKEIEETKKTEDKSQKPISEAKPFPETKSIPEAKSIPETTPSKQSQNQDVKVFVYAGPAVRRFARELGVELSNILGTGRRGRITAIDVKNFVKQKLTQSAGASMGGNGLNLPAWPAIDHAKFGEVSIEPLSRIKKLSGSYLHRNWVMVPHVTQFDEADITELERFRKESQDLASQQGIKLTPLVFIMKAVVASLKAFPTFNASLDPSGTQLILKKYFHLGVAVDTENGLVVPVVRDVDQKGLFQLAFELGELSQKARKGQLTALEMQGSSFSISSLGGIGGTAFTPIVNVPDVAILGVSKAQMKPIFDQGEFKPCLMLPLSLSYDHRVIDGAQAARFTTHLVKQLSDIRRMLF